MSHLDGGILAWVQGRGTREAGVLTGTPGFWSGRSQSPNARWERAVKGPPWAGKPWKNVPGPERLKIWLRVRPGSTAAKAHCRHRPGREDRDRHGRLVGAGLETVRALASTGAALWCRPGGRSTPATSWQGRADTGSCRGAMSGGRRTGSCGPGQCEGVRRRRNWPVRRPAHPAGWTSSSTMRHHGKPGAGWVPAGKRSSPRTTWATLPSRTCCGRRWPPRGARVVSLSSTGHKLSAIRFDDINFDAGYDKWRAYGQAKTANALFAVQLDALGRDWGCAPSRASRRDHDGASAAPAAGGDDRGGLDGRARQRWTSGSRHRRRAPPPQCGPRQRRRSRARAVSTARTANCRAHGAGIAQARIRGVDAHAVDREAATRLWQVSAEMTGSTLYRGGRG